MNSSPSRILDQTDLMPARSSSNNSLPKDVTDETDNNANEPNLHAMSRYVLRCFGNHFKNYYFIASPRPYTLGSGIVVLVGIIVLVGTFSRIIKHTGTGGNEHVPGHFY